MKSLRAEIGGELKPAQPLTEMGYGALTGMLRTGELQLNELVPERPIAIRLRTPARRCKRWFCALRVNAFLSCNAALLRAYGLRHLAPICMAACLAGCTAFADSAERTGLATPVQAGVGIQHESFFAGGVYSGPGTAQVMQGQMFVEALIPQRITHPYPLVLVHGGAQTAMNWMTTPDGRKGWAQWFAEGGWKVYMVDVPARGRSAWQPDLNGKLSVISASRVERAFTAPQDFTDYPQARLHTQWPGTGRVGDPAFDQFYASQVPFVGRSEGETLTLSAVTALLDRIGPAILVVHSQGGLNAWSIADAHPDKVKGVVAIEPNGPPFKDVTAAPDTIERPYGLTTTALTFEPPVSAESPLTFEREARPEAPDRIACWLPKGSPRRLPRLAGIPVLLATGEGSYHAQYDHCTSRFLADAGVTHDFVRLGDQGIHGNGHMMMLEKNNLEIAAFIGKWMAQKIK